MIETDEQLMLWFARQGYSPEDLDRLHRLQAVRADGVPLATADARRLRALERLIEFQLSPLLAPLPGEAMRGGE